MIRQAMSQVRENMTGMKWDTKGLWRPPSSLLRMYTYETVREHGWSWAWLEARTLHSACPSSPGALTCASTFW